MTRIGLLILSLSALFISACSPANFSKEAESGETCKTDYCGEQNTLSRFGMVSDRTDCVFCHLTIQGDIGATSTKPFALHRDSLGKIFGNVFSLQPIQRVGPVQDKDHVLVADQSSGADRVAVEHPSNQDYRIQEGVDDLQFPAFKADVLKSKATGTLTENGASKVDKVHSGNLVIDGRNKSYEINGEIYVDGDVVVYGDKITGAGTVYAKGNIYIPDDINLGESVRALFSSFRADVPNADNLAKAAVAQRVPFLRLAAGEYIIIGDPGDSQTKRAVPAGALLKNYYDRDYTSFYTGEALSGQINGSGGLVNTTRTKAVDDFLNAEVNYAFADRATRIRVFNWDPNYMQRLKAEYELTPPAGKSNEICGSGKNFRVGLGMVARIDATMYAAKGIGGMIGGGANFAINGGVVTRSLNLLGGTPSNLSNDAERTWRFRKSVYEMEKDCTTVGKTGTWLLSKQSVNPFNGLKLETNVITYDYRLRNGGSGFNLMRETGY